MNKTIRGRQDSNLRRRCLVDFESTPVTAWVRPHMILSYVFLNILVLHPRTAKKLDEKGIDPLASRMLSERSTTELHTRDAIIQSSAKGPVPRYDAPGAKELLFDKSVVQMPV